MRVEVVISGGQFKELVDELNLTPNIIRVYPLSLPLADHVHGFVALKPTDASMGPQTSRATGRSYSLRAEYFVKSALSSDAESGAVVLPMTICVFVRLLR
jgi:hypothetical protein